MAKIPGTDTDKAEYGIVYKYGDVWKVETSRPFEATASGFKTEKEAREWANERAEEVEVIQEL